MEVKLFNEIITNVNKLIDNCEAVIGDITCSNDIDNMSLKQLRTKSEDCKSLLSDMTKIVSSELYHLLGMGNLTVVQQSQFIARIQVLLAYRPDIQLIASLCIPSTPKIPTKNEYKLSLLSNRKLKVSSEARLKRKNT